MKRFSEVTPEILRGGAPAKSEVRALKDLWGVNRIVSLDLEEGEKINKECEALDIEHLIIPIEHKEKYSTHQKLKQTSRFLSQNIVPLFSTNPVTFVHCIHGRDRTGFVVAVWRVKGEGWDPHKAIEEAMSFGFGQGISPEERRFFIEEIQRAGEDQSSAEDIATSVRKSFDRGSITGPTNGTNYLSPVTPIQDLVQDYPHTPTRDVAQIDDSRRRRRKLRMQFLQDMNEAMANVGINDNINPMLRGISPEGLSPLGIMPYGNYYL